MAAKRAASDGAPSPKRSKAADRPLFFFVAGAGGALPGDKAGEPPRSIKTLLAGLGDVAGPMESPPPGGAGCNAKALAKLHAAVAAACAAHPGRDVWLATQSFGGRLAVHSTIGGVENRGPGGKPAPWTEADGRREWPAAVKGILAFGYPIHHSKQNRAAPLLELAPETRMLFVMGEKDEQSLGKPVDKGLLTGTIAKMPNKAAVEVLWVPRGGHNALDVPKTKRQESNDRILETVAAFIGK